VGQLGNGTYTEANVATAVTTSGALSGVSLAQVSGGADHTCAVDTTGLAYCWGDNTNGELGNPATTTGCGAGTCDNVPLAVTASSGTALSGVTLAQISAGNDFTCAMGATGAVYCWGAGASGQLGNGTTTTSQVTPVPAASSRSPPSPAPPCTGLLPPVSAPAP
jgi:alpha-tubulin suppressor-like RCC1 family protein